MRFAAAAAPKGQLFARRANFGFEERDGLRRLGHLDDELIVELVVEYQHDRTLGVVHIPEDVVSVLMEGSGGEDAGKVCTEQPDSMPPATGGGGICAHGANVREGNLEPAPQRPELVDPLHLEHRLVAGYTDLDHVTLQAKRNSLGDWHQRVPDDRAIERAAAEREVEVALGDRKLEGHAPLETLDERGEQRSIDRVELERLRAVNALARELAQELGGILVRIDRHAWRRLARLVESCRIRCAELHPKLESAGEIANRERRLIRVGDPTRERDSFAVFEAVGEHA